MLDDHAAHLRAIPAIHMYDRDKLDRYVGTVAAQAELLEARLDAAQARHIHAERRLADIGAEDQDLLTHVLLDVHRQMEAEQAAHEQALAALWDTAADEARQILRAAEREVLELQRALGEVLDEHGAPLVG